MTFRNDHEAALARADALENELERQRVRAEAQTKEAAALRRERDGLKATVSELQEETRRPAPPAVRVQREADPVRTGEREPGGREMSFWELLLLAAVLIALTGGVGLLAK